MNIDVEALIRDYESAVCKIIVYCVAELPFHLGINRTISVLKGSKSTFIIDYKLNNLDTYSLLSTFAAKDLRAIIGTLVESELLEIELVEIIHNRRLSFAEFFELSEDDWQNEFQVSAKEKSKNLRP